MLHSFERGNLALDSFTGNFRVELDERMGSAINVVQIVVGPSGSLEAPEQALVDFIRATYDGHPTPDLIVTTSGAAAVFARKYRQQLFPEVPLLFASVDRRWVDAAPLRDNEAAVPVDIDFPKAIDAMLQVLPDTRRVFWILGSGEVGRFWRTQLESQLGRYEGRLTSVWSDSLSLSEILRRCRNLDPGTAIFYVLFGTDAAGAAYADERVLADLRGAANAPVFSQQSAYLDHGIVGGPLMSVDELSRRTADIAMRLLHGEPPRNLRPPPQQFGAPTYDWRELQRWNIDEGRLPAGSTVLYRRPSLWQEYRFTVLAVAGILMLQSVLIIGLLYQRRARQRAELESRRHLALAADVSRRQTMSALTNTLAHELGQPLSSMIHNARALQMMIAAGQTAPDTTAEILSDIQTQGARATQIIDRQRSMLRSHEIERTSIDLRAVIQESMSLVDYDRRGRQIDAAMDLPATPCIVHGDPVLLKQVIVNLLMNAMDAMNGVSQARRRVVVRANTTMTTVQVDVSDSGTGLPAKLDGKLFTPFVTTKSHGLGIGLTIARSIVDAHGGTIDARNNDGEGATFTVVLPRSEGSPSTEAAVST